MTNSTLVASFTIDGAKVRIFQFDQVIPGVESVGGDGEAFAAFIRHHGGRDDEWWCGAAGHIAIGENAAVTALDFFEGSVRDTHLSLDPTLQVHLAAAFGVTWSEVVRDPYQLATRQIAAYDELSPIEKTTLRRMALEDVRKFRNRKRGR